MPRETAAPKASISNRRPTEGDLLTSIVRPKMERGQEGGWEKFFGWVDEGGTPLRQAQGRFSGQLAGRRRYSELGKILQFFVMRMANFTIREFRRGDFEILWEIDQKCFPPGISYSQVELL